MSHSMNIIRRTWLYSPCLLGLGMVTCLLPTIQAEESFLHNGDRMVFLGDSITEQLLYTNFIEAYALTRHPQWQLTFRNTGWAGDTAFFRSRCHTDGAKLAAADEATQQQLIDAAIRRGLERDVLALKPTVVSIDFGMNDISAKPTDQMYPIYVRCITSMVTLLKEHQARTILLTPQPVEEKRSDPDQDDKNKSLRKFSNGLKEVADKTGTTFVDQFDPYMTVLLRARAGNPDQFIGGGHDAVHPGAVGHTIMAWAILKGLGAASVVSRAQIDSKNASVIVAEACRIDHIKMADGGIGFDRLDEALPMPIHPKAVPALTLIPILEDLNRYELQITGLAPGHYQLFIDGEPAMKMTAEEVEKGLNLAMNAGPITRQSQDVMNEIGRKNDLFFKRWREVQLVPKVAGQEPKPGAEAQRVAEMAKLDQQISAVEAQINTLRQPRVHRFELKPIVQ